MIGLRAQVDVLSLAKKSDASSGKLHVHIEENRMQAPLLRCFGEDRSE